MTFYKLSTKGCVQVSPQGAQNVKKEKTIKRHTKLRSAVFSNSFAMTNQKVGVITTRIGAMTFLDISHFTWRIHPSHEFCIFEFLQNG